MTARLEVVAFSSFFVDILPRKSTPRSTLFPLSQHRKKRKIHFDKSESVQRAEKQTIMTDS